MELRFWAATDVGRVRDHNEDNFLVDKKLQLFVVCDGMGGHAAGEVASAVCVRTVPEVVAGEAELLAKLRQQPTDEAAAHRLTQLMGHAVVTANSRIFEMARQDASRRGMGTTCVALVVAGEQGFVSYVGDSRLYRVRRGEVEQVTDDHSLLNEMIRQGKVPAGTSEENFPHKNAVTRAVGVREKVQVDAYAFPIEEGDRLLICSDGLSEYFTSQVDLSELMGGPDPQETAQRCIDHANKSGGKDNITVAIVDALSAEASAEQGVEREKVIEILRRTPYFHYLGAPELEQVRRMAKRVEVGADDPVIDGDDENHSMFIILKGSVSLQLDGEQVAVLTTGEHFGEMALIDAQDENDTNLVAQSLEPSIFLTISRDQFVGLLRNAPSLALKLLWNFVQVFADRLQAVPPEYRFTPDEWRGDPEAIADVTPPAGQLVFDEDKGRIRKTSDDGEVETLEVDRLERKASGFESSRPTVTTSTDLEPLPPPTLGGASSSSGTNSAGGEAPEEDDESGEDLRATMDLGMVDPSMLDTPPPSSRKMSAPKASAGRDKERIDRGLSSGTYDQSLLEEGRGDAPSAPEDEPLPPPVKFNTRDDESVNTEPMERRSDPSPPNIPGEDDDADDDESDIRKTVKLDWSSDEMEAMSPPATPPPLRKPKAGGADDRPVPAAAILDRARRKSSESKEEKTKKGRTAARSGESDVKAEASEPTKEISEPKIMISPDLMADVEDDD